MSDDSERERALHLVSNLRDAYRPAVPAATTPRRPTADEVARRLATYGVGLRHRRVFTQEQVRDSRPIRVVRKWLAEGATGPLIMLGLAGTGKTLAAIYALSKCTRELPPSWAHPRFQALGDLAALSQWDKRWRLLGSCSLLVADDLGREPDFCRTALFATFDRRYRDELPTIITSNMTRATLIERYDAGLIDRWREDGTVFECAGQSLRESARRDER